MTLKFRLRKTLHRLGLLHMLRRVKKRFVRAENAFKPSDPRVLISTAKCLDWLAAQGLAEGSDYLEFGIFRGFNLWFAQAYARSLGVNDMRFFGFDSFFGLPPIEEIDNTGPFLEGDFSAYRDEVEKFLTRFGVDWTRTHLVEGFFDRTLTPATREKHGLRRCGFAVVDCDLYTSTVDVLKFLPPLLGHKTLLFFDDWDDFGDGANRGEPRAFAEFTETHAASIRVEPFRDLKALGGKGKAFMVERITPVSDTPR